MTKRRPTNKKPSGSNRALGNCLANEREKARTRHRTRERDYGAEKGLEISKNTAHNIDSVIDETGLEEFLANAELAGTNFAAERGEFRLLDLENSKTVVSTINATESLDELYRKYGDRLRIPRRPPKHLWETADDLTRLENEHFLEWRKSLAELQEGDGVLLTPFERNLDLWRQLWRVIERSDIIVQILDARNPLLFRNLDLEACVKECDIAKQNIYLVNKVDLLSKEQIKLWRKWFLENGVDVVFWSALEPENSSGSEKKKIAEHDDSDPSSSSDETEEKVVEEDDTQSSGNTYQCDESVASCNRREVRVMQSIDVAEEEVPILNSAAELIAFFKARGHAYSDISGRSAVVVGMVGYPNVGKSSTINKILNQKKVSVSATPGKTRHFQTLMVDDELTLCDCPGLVMPSFALSRSEMILNGIVSVDHMRDYMSPVELLLLRIPRGYFERIYSVMLTDVTGKSDDAILSAHNLLTAIAFIRGFMSSSGVADCSRAARLVLKDVVNGKVKWVAAPPNVDQKEFDKLTYDVPSEMSPSSRVKQSSAIMQQLEKRRLLQDMKTSDKLIDQQFFLGSSSGAHIRSMRSYPKQTSLTVDAHPSKKHFNKNKREKLRRIFAD